MQKLITVSEAAALANVSTRTIYYHIHKSKKLQFIYGNNTHYVNVAQLKKLYAATTEGCKQHLSTTTYSSHIQVNAQTQQQARELIAQAQQVIAQLQHILV
jgi:DNA-binding transcriptional MerR regulator